MKALRLHGAGDLRLHDEPSPVPAAGEVLLRVTAVGLCGSDRHWFDELVLGHEFAGVIETGSRAGERVAVDPAIPCARCAVCLAGQPHLCLRLRFAGHGSTDGALRSRLTWPEALAYALPDSLSDAEAALLEPLGVALHALDLGHVRPGARAGVFGCGPIGCEVAPVTRPLVGSLEKPTDNPPLTVSLLAAFGWLPPPLMQAYVAEALSMLIV